MRVFKLALKPYRRTFKNTLHTNHEGRAQREGICLRLASAEGASGYGEFAPLPCMGSETFQEGRAFLEELNGVWKDGASVPDNLPAVNFALGSALADLHGTLPAPQRESLPIAALLPNASPEALARKRAGGFKVFKCKANFGDLKAAIGLLEIMKDSEKLRIDLNASLNANGLRRWCEALSGRKGLEFIEQPLPIGEEAAALKLSETHGVPMALDESLVGNRALKKALLSWGASFSFVLKPSLQPWDTMRKLATATQKPKLIYSSALETEIGFQHVVRLALSDNGHPTPPAGLDVADTFAEDKLGPHAFAFGNFPESSNSPLRANASAPQPSLRLQMFKTRTPKTIWEEL